MKKVHFHFFCQKALSLRIGVPLCQDGYSEEMFSFSFVFQYFGWLELEYFFNLGLWWNSTVANLLDVPVCSRVIVKKNFSLELVGTRRWAVLIVFLRLQCLHYYNSAPIIPERSEVFSASRDKEVHDKNSQNPFSKLSKITHLLRPGTFPKAL